MKEFLKKFPLTIYSVIVLLIAFNVDRDVQYDSGELMVLVILAILFLSLPILAVGQIYTLLNIQVSLLWVIPIFFLLDLLIICLRNGSLKNIFTRMISNFNKDKNESK